MRFHPLRAPLLLLGALCLPAAIHCGPPSASGLAELPVMPTGKQQTKCHVAASVEDPLIVEWPDAERGRLESLARRGPIAVRYQGCEMRLLPQCKSPLGAYRYAPITRKTSTIVIKNEDELYANLPVGAVKLEGKLKTAGSLEVGMVLVGRYETDVGEASKRGFEGDCAGATHVVSALSVGAFTFSAGAGATVGGGVGALGVGAGGSSAAHKEVLSQDGEMTACRTQEPGATSPPSNCGALLRMELVPLQSAIVQAPKGAPPVPCPFGTVWDGTRCGQPGGFTVTVGPTGPVKHPTWVHATLWAVGTLGLTASVATGTIALANGVDPSGNCSKARAFCENSEATAKMTRAHSYALWTDVLWIGSTLAFAGSFFVPYKASTPESARVTPVVVPGGGGAAVGGAF